MFFIKIHILVINNKIVIIIILIMNVKVLKAAQNNK